MERFYTTFVVDMMRFAEDDRKKCFTEGMQDFAKDKNVPQGCLGLDWGKVKNPPIVLCKIDFKFSKRSKTPDSCSSSAEPP